MLSSKPVSGITRPGFDVFEGVMLGLLLIRNRYDFSKEVSNTYVARVLKQITINLK